MTSEFVATISRLKHGTIMFDTHETPREALEDLLSKWGSRNETADEAAEAITENMDPDMINEITKILLETSEPDDFGKILDVSYYMQEVMLRKLLDSVDTTTQENIMRDCGWVREEDEKCAQ